MNTSHLARCGNQQENPQNYCAKKVKEERGMRPFTDEDFHEQ
jgi:hypothetical protein